MFAVQGHDSESVSFLVNLQKSQLRSIVYGHLSKNRKRLLVYGLCVQSHRSITVKGRSVARLCVESFIQSHHLEQSCCVLPSERHTLGVIFWVLVEGYGSQGHCSRVMI